MIEIRPIVSGIKREEDEIMLRMMVTIGTKLFSQEKLSEKEMMFFEDNKREVMLNYKRMILAAQNKLYILSHRKGIKSENNVLK